MTKVTHKGKQYTIGGLYEFSDKGKQWRLGILTKLSTYGASCFQDDNYDSWELIREPQNIIIGTIEDAPIELEDGCAYQFVWGDLRSIGFYESKSKVFNCPQGWAPQEDCEDIVKLVPEEK